jgi:hypothetical protein
MYENANNLDPLLTEGPQSILERTLVAEYLICKGYLVSDLEQLPSETAQALMMEAHQFARLRLADMESAAKPPWEIGSTISLN